MDEKRETQMGRVTCPDGLAGISYDVLTLETALTMQDVKLSPNIPWKNILEQSFVGVPGPRDPGKDRGLQALFVKNVREILQLLK